MANTKFTARLREAVAEISTDGSIPCLEHKSGRLYSPVFRKGRYEWASIMDSDGLLVSERSVVAGEGAEPGVKVKLKVGVVIQSEDATAQTKPNPMGKAALAHLPSGVWIDLEDSTRVRLDHLLVLFVVPKGAAANRQKRFATAKRNVANAADLMPDATYLELSRGLSKEKVTAALKKAVRGFLVGKGRPRHAA